MEIFQIDKNIQLKKKFGDKSQIQILLLLIVLQQ